jgi:hypothetical protein
MKQPTCAVCNDPIQRDPVLFRAKPAHQFCQLRVEASGSEEAANAFFARCTQVGDAVEWERDDER